MFALFKKDLEYAGDKQAALRKRKGTRSDRSVRHPAFIALVCLNVFGGLIALYLFLNRTDTVIPATEETSSTTHSIETRAPRQLAAQPVNPTVNEAKEIPEPKTTVLVPIVKKDSVVVVPKKAVENIPPPVTIERKTLPPSTPIVANSTNNKTVEVKPAPVISRQPLQQPSANGQLAELKTKYTVVAPKAHFHNRPDESTRRDAFINPWNKAVLQPLDDQNGFIYIVYTNPWGQTSKGWLQKKDLKPIN